VFVSLSSSTVLTAADVLYLGWLGTEPLAAIGASAALVFLLTAFGTGLVAGVRVQTAQSTGAGASARVNAFGWQGLWLAFGLGLVAWTLLPLGDPALRLVGASDDVRPLAWRYFVVRGAGAPFDFLFLALSCWFQGRGDTRTPMIATLVGNALNVVIDPPLIFGWGPLPALGVVGAAATTVLGQAIGFTWLALAARRQLRTVAMPDPRMLRDIWSVGSAQGLQMVLDVASYAVFASILARAGDVHLAAHVIVVRIVMLSFLPTHALMETTIVLVGQRVGARDPNGARHALRLARVQAMAFMAVCSLPLLLVPDLLASAFGASDAVRDLMRPAARLYATVQVLDGFLTVTYGALVGAGDTRFAMRALFFTGWLVKLPIAAALVLALDGGLLGAWLGIAAELVVLAAVMGARARGERWLAPRAAPSAIVAAEAS
jgi:MATE family multidrug resistance protein